MSANQELFEFKFYEWEKKFRDNPYLDNPLVMNGRNIHGEKLVIWLEGLLQGLNL